MSAAAVTGSPGLGHPSEVGQLSPAALGLVAVAEFLGLAEELPGQAQLVSLGLRGHVLGMESVQAVGSDGPLVFRVKLEAIDHDWPERFIARKPWGLPRIVPSGGRGRRRA
jgi:hypothetical protein